MERAIRRPPANALIVEMDAPILREFGHTILSPPDLYGYGVKADDILLTDGGDRPSVGVCLLPVVEAADHGWAVTWDRCGVKGRIQDRFLWDDFLRVSWLFLPAGMTIMV